MTKPQAITWRFRHLQEIQGGNHMKEKTEDKIPETATRRGCKDAQGIWKMLSHSEADTACEKGKGRKEKLSKWESTLFKVLSRTL